MGRPYALLRAGFPYLKTIGMRRITNFPVAVATSNDETIYVLCRSAGGAQIARLNLDDDNLGPIGGYGTDPGKLKLPTAIVLDREENIFVSDEELNRITILDKEGKFLQQWGETGAAEGQLNRPSGIAFDPKGDLYVADTMNHRVQKFTAEGKFLLAFGRKGSGPGELNMPWGLAVDELGDVYVADWRNDRVQKFSSDSVYQLSIGRTGAGPGEFNRPAGVAVDSDGDIYVADTGNDRVQQFDPTGRLVGTFLGDATLSRSGREYLMTNARPMRLREMSDLEPQKRLRSPKSVHVDAAGRLFIPDFGSYRVQIYQKEAIPLGPDLISPPLRSPTLQTT
ncbi:MAG TPA: NHL repeat-containing protein [Chloroflexota bacterium]|nr:NHL repeat-containing protein [Chloroflexota bacterium]